MASPRPSRSVPAPLLRSPGWTPGTRAWLDRLIRQGAGRGLPVTFDFDNTLVSGDVGEATLAMLVRQKRLMPATVAALTPAFRTGEGTRVSASTGPDLTAYYEALLGGTGHGPDDPSPLTQGYTWAVRIMAGLTPRQVVQATRAVALRAVPGEKRGLEVTPGKTAYPLPWFHAPMVELVAVLLRQGFAVWIVSASNVWSVRWMVQHQLNPALADLGYPEGIPPQQVVGVSPLLRDRKGQILKDRVLVRSDEGYARLEPARLSRFTLTGELDLPAPVYSGKVACLWDALRRPPWLAAGDSPGDLPMLAFAQHRLWLARLEKPAYTAAMLEERRASHRGSWSFQPVLMSAHPGLVGDPAGLDQTAAPASETIRRTLSLLAGAGTTRA